MKKLTAFILLIWVFVANAQIDDLYRFNTSNQQIVQMAVENSFKTVVSSYRLQDLKTQQLYGRNGNDAFGSVEFWGVLIEGGMILFDQTVHPWVYDKNYHKYKGQYKAVPHQFIIVPEGRSYLMKTLNMTPCDHKNMLYYVQDTVISSGDGLTVDFSDGVKNGWIVWLTQEADSTQSFIVVKKQIDLEPSIEFIEMDGPNTDKEVKGGIFVYPIYPSIGCVELCLCGVLVNQNEKWFLARPLLLSSTHGQNNMDVDDNFSVEDSEVMDLTPVE